MTMISKGAAALSLALVLSSAAATPVTYNFTFTDYYTPGQIDAMGSFVTGDAAAANPGYFLLTSLTYTSLLVNGILQTGSVVQTSFYAGSAYDPATGAFVNHFQNGTYTDYGGGFGNGSLGDYTSVDTSGSDFSQDLLSVNGNTFSFDAFTSTGTDISARYDAVLSISGPPLAPETVPEPGSIALIGFGLVGLAASRRSSKG